jgi:hypothetical protein
VTGHRGGAAPFRTKEDIKSATQDDGGTRGPALTLSGNYSGRAALKKEQQKQLESSHRENRAAGKECKPNHRCHKHSPRRSRNGGTSVSYQDE